MNAEIEEAKKEISYMKIRIAKYEAEYDAATTPKDKRGLLSVISSISAGLRTKEADLTELRKRLECLENESKSLRSALDLPVKSSGECGSSLSIVIL